MLIQQFQNGNLYKEGEQYILKIDGKEFTGQTAKETLEAYSKSQRKGKKK